MKSCVLVYVVVVMACAGTVLARDIKTDMIERCADGKEHLVAYLPEGEAIDLTEGDSLRILEWDIERFTALSKANEVLVVARCHVEDNRYSAFPRPRLDTLSSEINEMLEMEYRFKIARGEAILSSELFHILVDVKSDTLVEYGPGPYIREKLDQYFKEEQVDTKEYAPIYVTVDERKMRFTPFPKGYARIVDMMDDVYGAYFLKYTRSTCKEVRSMEDLFSCTDMDVNRFAYISLWYGGDFYYLIPYTGEVPLRYQLF